MFARAPQKTPEPAPLQKEPKPQPAPAQNEQQQVSETVTLRDNVLKKSVSNTSTGGENKQSLSMFDNRTKVYTCIHVHVQ